jgi:UDP-N-acetylmuramoylalanine--D-glutamate ligase
VSARRHGNVVVVVGLAATGEAVVRRLRAEGTDVVVVEDRPQGDAYTRRAAVAREQGASVVEAPTAEHVAKLVADAGLVVPSPLVNERHPAIVAAREHGIPVRSEIDLAAQRARVPIVGVTGTNGKTTVTSLVAAMLAAGGRRAIAAGNIGHLLLDAVDEDADVLVAEVSSYQLAFCEDFRPAVAVLLAVAPDHLDWHGRFEHYAASKARVFAHQRDDDLLVYDADDAVARRLAQDAPARRVGVSIAEHARADCFHVLDGVLVAPDGTELATVREMHRALPHDRTNALAASAAARELGATAHAIRDALSSYATLPHRVALVGEANGVRWYDDSKATNPHAALHAVRAFDSVVLLAGGRNKGLDLSVIADAAGHVRAVVAFGESAPDIERAFAGVRPVRRASSMRDAVRIAADRAQAGDVVLLSPGCASFDAYESYAARGDDFAAAVRDLIGDPA